MRYLAAILVFAFLCCSSIAAPKFPALTGRVVDNAQILSAATQNSLSQMLAEHEAKTTNQVVVVTIPSLGGQQIEEYSYQLGRYWGIGQKEKNNGVVFVIAPNDRKVWITVGYGLEGTLTDALCSQITQTIILPAFKSGQMERGVVDGTVAILSTLNGEQVVMPVYGQSSNRQNNTPPWVIILALVIIVGLRLGLGIWIIPFGSFGSSSGGSGGFSGGGGSFGGGGGGGSW